VRTPFQHAGLFGPVVAALLLILVPGGISAQVAGDTASRSGTAGADSSAAGYGNSGSQSGVDTSRSVPAADSARTGPARHDSLPPSGASSAPAIPADTVLSGACSYARAGTVAPGLLVVVFRDEATAEERSAALTEAGGSAAGTAPTGGEYVRASAEASSRDVADRLVLNPAVASVSERSCPAAARQ
jgi:hypothetical protein